MPRQAMFTFLLILTVSACASPTRPTPLTPVTVQLLWTHNAEFAGFYAADQNGYYAAEGLAISFRQGGPTGDYLTPVSDGTAQFGQAGADDVLLARADGKPLRVLATIYRRSPVAFVALANSGITRPQDFVGKTIRTNPPVVAQFRAMMARVGIRPDQYTEVNLPSEVSVFATSQVPVWSSYINNFAITLQQAGYKLNFIYPDDYGVHFYADSILTNDQVLAKNPDLVRRFLRATLKGWTFAVENPSAIGLMVAKYDPSADIASENAKMTAGLPFINTGEDHIGWMKPEIWAGMEKTLREQGVLTNTLMITDVYTMQFLKEIYPSR